MIKVGKIEIYDNWNGVILAEGKKYVFRKDDIISETVKKGDSVEFVPEIYSRINDKEKILTARFIKIKGKRGSLSNSVDGTKN